jgi:hypothetical protein
MARKEILELEGKVNSKELVKEFDKVQTEVNNTTKAVDNFSDKSKKDLKAVQKQSSKTEKGVKGIGKGFKILGGAMKAAGIGLIVGLVAKLTGAFLQNQKIMDGINSVFETVNIVFSQLTTAVINIFNSVIKATSGFTALGKVVSGIVTLALTPMKLSFFAIKLALQQAQLAWEKSFFGDKDQNTIEELNKGIAQTKLDIVGVGKDAIDASTDIATNFSKAIDEIGTSVNIATTELGKISVGAAKEQAEALVEARKAAKLASAQQQLLIEKYDQQAEIQRQIRDDDRVGLSERIKANERLNEILEKQQEAQLAQAELSIKAARLELNVNNNIENQLALTDALAEKQGVLASIEGFRSEQKVNEASLERELLELQNRRTEAESKLSFEKRRAAAEEIEGELKRLERLKEIAVDEREFELTRLQEKINNTNAETQARIDAEIEFAQVKFELDQKLKASSDKITEYNKKKAETDKEIDKKVNESKVQMAQQSLGQIGSLLSESAEAQKAVGIATALIDTYKGITAGVALGFPAAIPAVAAAAATGFATVKSILSTKLPTVKGATGGGGASGGTRSAQAVAPQAVAPSFNVVGDSGSNQITDAINTQGSKPARAYVVSKDITTQQELDRNTQGNSSLG